MRRYLIILMILALAACKETGYEITQYTIEQFYKNEAIGGGSFSMDESKLLISSNADGIYNAYELPLDGSDKVQLTNSESESIFAISYFPNDDRILYSADKGGNEISHIYLRNMDGTIEDLTPDEEARADFAGWNKSLTKFYYMSNKRDARFMDMYKVEIESMEHEMIYENKDGMDISLVSEDDNYFVLSKTITTSNNDLYLVHKKTGETKLITEHEGDVSYAPQFFNKENTELFLTTNEGNEFTYLIKYNLETSAKEKVWNTDWDVWYAYNSFNEKYRVIGVNQDAQTVVHVYNQETGEELVLPEIEGGNISGVGISRSEKWMRLSVTSSKTTTDLYVYNFETKELKRLTNTLNPEIKAEDLVDGEVIRYTSYDGLEIPAILYKPHIATARNKVPALVWVHGGPGGQSRVGYFALIQYLVNHGYTILAVNNRGSSGYGKTFYAADDQKHGEADLKDCVEAKKYFESLGYVDMDKIGIIGGSYGGYMVMAALAFAPEEFDVGVNIFGVTNWLRTLKSIPPWWESFREALYKEMGDPTTADSVRLYNISPLFHAKNVTKPLMVLQGANDPRVLQVESDEMVAGVKANGVPVEYVLFPDEGHGFRKKENEIKGYGQVLEFLDKYLKKADEDLIVTTKVVHDVITK